MTLEEATNLLITRQTKVGVYTDEAKILKDVKEVLELLDECCVLRQEAVHRSGIPDLVLCYKGRFIAIELKDDKGTPSALQKVWQAKIQAASGISIIADSVYPILEALHCAALKNFL